MNKRDATPFLPPLLAGLALLVWPVEAATTRVPAVFDNAVKLVREPTSQAWSLEIESLRDLQTRVEQKAPFVPYPLLPEPHPGETSRGDRLDQVDGQTLVVDGTLNVNNLVKESVVVVTGDLKVGASVERSLIVVGGNADIGTHTLYSMVLVRPKNGLKVGSHSDNCILGAQTLENNQYIERTVLIGDFKPGSYPEKRRSEVISARILSEGFR